MDFLPKLMIGSVIAALFLAYGVTKYGATELNTKITLTNDMAIKLDEAGKTAKELTTKDYSLVTVEKLKELKIISYDVVGSGEDSYFVAPFDAEMRFNLKPSSNDKDLVLTITNTSSSDMDSDGLQLWEDNVNDYMTKKGASIAGYTSSSADGEIQITFD